MKTIGFYSPYKHLPDFSKFVESNFNCIELKNSKPDKCDFIFYAPNYAKFILTDEHLKGTNVKAILTPSTGKNHIEVSSVPIYDINSNAILENIYSTAEHNIYLCLHITRQVTPIVELKESVIGILGYGRLGRMIETIGKNLFKKVEVKDVLFSTGKFFETTDFLSININYTKGNIKFVNREFISKFNKDIFIINTSRGEVVNEEDILELVKEGKVLGYATDVLTDEHLNTTPFLLREANNKVVITPHIGGTAIQAQEKAYREVLNYIL